MTVNDQLSSSSSPLPATRDSSTATAGATDIRLCARGRIADDRGMGRFADMFVDPDADPRTDPPAQVDERATITAFLRWQSDTR